MPAVVTEEGFEAVGIDMPLGRSREQLTAPSALVLGSRSTETSTDERLWCPFTAHHVGKTFLNEAAKDALDLGPPWASSKDSAWTQHGAMEWGQWLAAAMREHRGFCARR